MAKILLVEDDIEIAGQINKWLVSQDHQVEMVHDGREGLDRIKIYQYDLAILDWQLPELDGIDILRSYRDSGGLIPILMLTGKSKIEDKGEGFQAGVDDYLTKPFDFRELSMRVNALLRRPSTMTGTVIEIRGLSLDTNTRILKRGEEQIKLTSMELALLEFLMRHPDEVFSQEALLNRVWSSESEASVDSVYTCIKGLRRKVDKKGDASVIETLYGLGYRFSSKI